MGQRLPSRKRMRRIENSKQQQCHHWRSSLLYSSLILVCSYQLATAFQTSSLVSSPHQQRNTLRSSLFLASGIDMDRQKSNSRSSDQSRQPWNAQNRRLVNGSTIGPILTDGLPTQPTQQVPGQPRKKMKPMPVTGYDAQSILDFYDRRPLQVGWRLNSLGFPLLGWYLGLVMDKALGIHEKPDVQRKRGKELRQHLVSSQSVALIKVSKIMIVL